MEVELFCRRLRYRPGKIRVVIEVRRSFGNGLSLLGFFFIRRSMAIDGTDGLRSFCDGLSRRSLGRGGKLHAVAKRLVVRFCTLGHFARERIAQLVRPFEHIQHGKPPVVAAKISYIIDAVVVPAAFGLVREEYRFVERRHLVVARRVDVYRVRYLVRNAELGLCDIRADSRMSGRLGKARKVELVLILAYIRRLGYIVEQACDDAIMHRAAEQLRKLSAFDRHAVGMCYALVFKTAGVQRVDIRAVRIEQSVLVCVFLDRARHVFIGLAERRIEFYLRRRNVQPDELRDLDLNFELFENGERIGIYVVSRTRHDEKIDERFKPVYIVPLDQPTELLAADDPGQARRLILFGEVCRGIYGITYAALFYLAREHFRLFGSERLFAQLEPRRRIVRALRLERRDKRRDDYHPVKRAFEVLDYIDMPVVRRIEAAAENGCLLLFFSFHI